MSTDRPTSGRTDPPTGARPVEVGELWTARGWAAGVLALATVALVVWLALLLAAGVVFAGFAPLLGLQARGLDAGVVWELLAPALPALLVGWCLGMAAVEVLLRSEGIGPRATGLLAGAVGSATGAAVLAAGPLL